MTPEAQEALQKQKWASRLNTLGLPAFEYPANLSDETRQQYFDRIMQRYHRAPEPGDPGFSVDTGTALGADRAAGAGIPYGLFDEIERAEPSYEPEEPAYVPEDPYSAYLEPLRPRLSGDAALAEDLYRRDTPPLSSQFPTAPELAPLAQPRVERTISTLGSGGGEVEVIEQPEVETKVKEDSDGLSTTETITKQPAKTIETKPSRDPSITSFSIMQKYDEWEGEFLQKLKAQSDSRRKKDFWFGTDTADSTWQNGLAFLKTMRSGAQSQADYLAEQELMQGLFDTDNPVRSAAERGANLEQLGQVAEIDAAMQGDAAPQQALIEQALFVAQNWWNTLSPESQKAELEKNGGATPQEVINRLAAEQMVTWKDKAGQTFVIGGQQTAEEKITAERLVPLVLDVYTDAGQLYSNAEADLVRYNYALELFEGGQINTGPLTKPWLTLQKWINQAFGGPKADLIITNKADVELRGADPETQSVTLTRLTDQRQQSIFRSPSNEVLANYEFLDSLFTLAGARNIQLTKGNVTEREMLMFLRIAPELTKTNAGNIKLITIMRNMAQKNVDYKIAAKEYMATYGYPSGNKPGFAGDSNTAQDWLVYMMQHPLVTKWEAVGGLGGVIPKEWYDEAKARMDGSAPPPQASTEGIPAPDGNHTVIGGPFYGDWGPDNSTPFQHGNAWFIVENGDLYQVRVNQ